MNEWRGGRDLVVLELMSNGMLSISQNISGTDSDSKSGHHLADMYFLDPSVAQERLSRAWAFSAAWWKYHDPYQRHDPLLYGVALYNVGTRYFIFDTPGRISRPSIENKIMEEIERTIQMIEMRFREWENR
ncbi:MAG: hypothetical protein JRJ69_18560 [Deltaproteobacteria bacterium]|nr:hypothetical protein [Deltaproteobacteria bacterium]